MIQLLLALCLALSPAGADAASDLDEASDGDLPAKARMEAFERLVAEGAMDINFVSTTAADNAADARQRWVATRVLGKVGGDRARDILLRLLDDEMPAMRAAAVQALGDLGDQTTTGKIAERLRDPAIIVRAGAAEALGKMADPTTVAPLADAVFARDNYYRGTSLWVRRHYVTALGKIGHKDALPTLLRCLDDTDDDVVTVTVDALERVVGFSYADGRSAAEEREAWRRWLQSELR